MEELEPEDLSSLILANTFRRLNRPYLGLIGLVINLICFYKHYSYRHYVLHYLLKSSYRCVFTLNFITLALDHFAVQIFLEAYLSQSASCKLILVNKDFIFCSNLCMTVCFVLAAVKAETSYAVFFLLSFFNCSFTVHSVFKAPLAIPKAEDALVCGFATVEYLSMYQICMEAVLLFYIFPIIYKLHVNLSKRFSIRSLSYWCQMLPFAALTLAAELLLIFHWTVEKSTHNYLLANEIVEFMNRIVGWILLPLFMMCVQFGFPFQTKRIEEIPEVILEMEDLEPFTFQRRSSDTTLRSEV